jgi:hypothetical protein
VRSGYPSLRAGEIPLLFVNLSAALEARAEEIEALWVITPNF